MSTPWKTSLKRGTGTIVASVFALSLFTATAQAAECGLQKYQDGTVGPAVCPNGEANTNVRKAYVKVAPAIMALGESTTRAQLKKAICADNKKGATGVTLYDAVTYQAALFDWPHGIVHEANRRIVADRFC
jgi:hypothetical protein